jgi:hypothetical protein
MSIVTNLPRTYNDQTKNREAAVDLSDHQYCAVALTGGASGRATITSPSGQGVWCVGILQNAPESGSLGEVLERGYSKAKAHESFNAGIELTVHDSTGELVAASSEDYVIAYSEEAATCDNALITVRVIDPYQKA